MMNEKIYQALVEGSRKYGVFGTGFTYSGHPVPAAVALETQRIYDERDIGTHVKSVSIGFLKRLRALADHPLVGEVRGLGLIGAVELVADKATRRNFDPSQGVAAYAVERATEHGLILRGLVVEAEFESGPRSSHEAHVRFADIEIRAHDLDRCRHGQA